MLIFSPCRILSGGGKITFAVMAVFTHPDLNDHLFCFEAPYKLRLAVSP